MGENQIAEHNNDSYDNSSISENIVILLDDTVYASTLAELFGQFGYSSSVLANFSELSNIVKTNRPRLAILSTELREGKTSDLLRELFKSEAPLPIIFVSESNDIRIHLEAVKTGGIALFTKPFETTSLLDKIDNIINRQEDPAYKVLVIDDSESIATYHSNILRSAGMETQSITNPLDVMPPLTDFDPDLILMDMYMPECSGADLAKIIRQRDTYNSIPIVFLSSEDDIEKQLETMKLGADDFLNKEITPKNLIASVSARIKRARKLRSLMTRDSLTNLLNHTSTKKQLNIEIKRAERSNTSLCFAMIDIDHFKQVNDNYGHLTGDRVIKQLSRLLQQRLRSTDIVGRYGGEEFAVIMPDTPIEAAAIVLDELRESFSKILHQSNGKEFNTTFSCGIADFPSIKDPTELNDQADKLLYKSKQAGRNCITPSVKIK